jgi:transcriptional regulator
MLRRPYFTVEDTDEVKRLIRENPWGTFVSSTPNGIVASHYPILLEEPPVPEPGPLPPVPGEPKDRPAVPVGSDPSTGLRTSGSTSSGSESDGITVVSHVGRPDEETHELGKHELLLIVQGPHGYISPGWYDPGEVIPTWNHVTAHLYGVPELLSEEENYAVLSRLVDEFESRMPEPRSLKHAPDHTAQVAKGTVGLRLRVTRFEARLKLSQNKAPHVRQRITESLEGDGPYASPALAAEMRRLNADAAP